MLIGSVLGLLAGYRGGLSDSTISRWVDLVYAMPALLVAIVVVGVLGGGYFLAVGLLVILFSPIDTRIVRGATLDQRSRAYVEAARMLGLSDRRIMARHIWPNVLPLALANAFLDIRVQHRRARVAVVPRAGCRPGHRRLGPDALRQPHAALRRSGGSIAPGIAMVVTAASVNVIGDWLYERLSDRGRAR